MYNTLKSRVSRPETGAGMDLVKFILGNGAHATIRRKDLLDAVTEAIAGESTLRANIMLNAVSASDGNRLFELARAMHDGPVPNPKETIQ